jgi:hypothetical protein
MKPISHIGIPCSDEKIPCSSRKNSLFRKEQGIGLQHAEIAARIDIEITRNRALTGNFSKFPVKFPVLREFKGSRPILLHKPDRSI